MHSWKQRRGSRGSAIGLGRGGGVEEQGQRHPCLPKNLGTRRRPQELGAAAARFLPRPGGSRRSRGGASPAAARRSKFGFGSAAARRSRGKFGSVSPLRLRPAAATPSSSSSSAGSAKSPALGNAAAAGWRSAGPRAAGWRTARRRACGATRGGVGGGQSEIGGRICQCSLRVHLE